MQVYRASTVQVLFPGGAAFSAIIEALQSWDADRAGSFMDAGLDISRPGAGPAGSGNMLLSGPV